MSDDVVRLSEAISELLSKENKDKRLGELPTVLGDYISSIKESIDSQEMDYNQLKREVIKHLRDVKEIRPGSVAQFLVGCMKDEKECPMRKEDTQDVSFIYDIDEGKLKAFSSSSPYTEDSCAIIYISGNPQEIDLESLRVLETNGFKKAKIKYRPRTTAPYRTLDIDNLRRYINMQPENGSIGKTLTFLSVLAIVIFFVLASVSGNPSPKTRKNK